MERDMFKAFRIETVWLDDRTVASSRDFATKAEAVEWNKAVPLERDDLERVLYRIEELPITSDEAN